MVIKTADRSGLYARIGAAVFGGYGLASLLAITIGQAFPAVRAEAVLTGMLVAAPVWVAVWVYAFTAASALRAWRGLAVCAIPMAVVLWVEAAG